MPTLDAERRRESNWAVMSETAEHLIDSPLKRVHLAAYGFPQFRRFVVNELLRKPVDLILLDITCLTKIHTMALAATLASSNLRLSWIVAYSSPENYTGFDEMDAQRSSWKDIIIAPLPESAFLFNESSSRGVVLPGHEADRLVVALAEIEPSGGVVVVAESAGRPDLKLVSERRNRQIFRQLTRSKGPAWTKRIVSIADINEMRRIVWAEVTQAKAKLAPVILFPYGPKPLIFASVFELVRHIQKHLGLCTQFRPAMMPTTQKV